MGDFEWMTYAETAAKVDAVGAALAGAGVAAGARVGVYGANSPEWMVAMQVKRERGGGEERGTGRGGAPVEEWETPKPQRSRPPRAASPALARTALDRAASSRAEGGW